MTPISRHALLLGLLLGLAARGCGEGSRPYEYSNHGSVGVGHYPKNNEFNYRQMKGYPVHIGNGKFEFLGLHTEPPPDEDLEDVEDTLVTDAGKGAYHSIRHGYKPESRVKAVRTRHHPNTLKAAPAQIIPRSRVSTKLVRQGYPNPRGHSRQVLQHPVQKQDHPEVVRNGYRTKPVLHAYNTRPQAVQPGYQTVPKGQSVIRRAHNKDRPRGYNPAPKAHAVWHVSPGDTNVREGVTDQGYRTAQKPQAMYPKGYHHTKQLPTGYYRNPYRRPANQVIKAKVNRAPVKYYTKVITKHGDSTHRPRAGDKVAVWYKGLFTDGSVFDTNIGKPGRGALTFRVGTGRVIRGWDEVLLTMGVGEKATVTIQPEWAYGKAGKGNGRIPPNSVLVFEMELESIN